MAATVTGDVLLLVERPGSLSPQEQALAEHLKEALHWNVRLHGVDSELPAKEEIRLVVVASRRALPELRTLDRPILVCNVLALFDVGMTMARPNVDFGQMEYATVFVGPDAIGQPLPAGLMGRKTIVDGRPSLGWARPAESAVIVATVGGDRGRAVAFAYDKGAHMPALSAAHRRGAFLALGTALTGEGWKLFDAVARGLAEGSAWAQDPGPAGEWFLKDGSPTRALSAHEYRDWVHEQVYNRVWGQLARLFSLVGVGGIITLGGLAAAWMTTQIGSTVTDKIDKAEARLQGFSAQKVAELFYDKSAVGEMVKKKLTETAKEQIDHLLNDPEVRKHLVSAAVNGLTDEGKMTEGLLAVYQKGTPGEEPGKRTLTLQLIFVYATRQQAEAVRQIALAAILDQREHELVRAKALEFYQPSRNFEKDQHDLEQVVNLFARQWPSPLLTAAYQNFLSYFSDEHTDFLLARLRENHLGPSSKNARDVLAAIAKMRPRNPSDPVHLKRFVHLAVDPNYDNRQWGEAGLVYFTQENPRAEISAKTRQEAVQKLLLRINELASTPDPFILDKKSLTCPILAGLLRPADLPFVLSWLGPEDRAGNRAAQALLYNWAERLQLEKDHPHDLQGVFEALLKVNDAGYGEGTCHFLEFVLRSPDSGRAQQFLAEFPRLHLGRLYEGNGFRGQNALRLAIQGDAASVPPFQGTLNLLAALARQERDKERYQDGVDQVWAALRQYASAPERQLGDLAMLRTVLKRTDPNKDVLVHSILGPLLVEAHLKLASPLLAAGQWDQALELYSKLAAAEPDDPRWLALRGGLHFQKLHRYDRALDDLVKVCRHPKATPADFETLGDLYLQLKNGDEASSAYQKARDRLPAAATRDDPDVPHKHVELCRKQALASILMSNQGGVIASLGEALKHAATPRDKARAHEVLGLFYLRNEQTVQQAFTNSTAVQKLSADSPWNWMIRYLSAKSLGKPAEADEAEQAWFRLREPSGLAAFVHFLSDSMKKEFGILAIKDEQLQPGQLIPVGLGSKIATVHTQKLIAGRRYVIDMESSVFDCYLYLRNAKGALLRWDDDSGGGLNARLVFQPETTDLYSIVATSLPGNSLGAYTLILRELPGKE